MKLMELDYSKPLNIGSDRIVSINELADMVATIAGKKISKTYNLKAAQGVRGRNADLKLVKEVLDWEPIVSLEEGLSKTYELINDMVKKEPEKQ